jgi:hypothetical protein
MATTMGGMLHALGVAGLLFAAAADARPDSLNLQQHTVSSLDGTTKLTLGPAGGLASVSVRGAAALGLAPSSGIELRVDGEVAGSSPPPVVTPLADGGVSFSREAAFGARKQHTATVTEAFRPAEDGAVEWSLTLKGSSANMFAPAIDVRLDAVAGGATDWTAWAPWDRPNCNVGAGEGCEGCDGRSSPLAPQPLRCFLAPRTSYGYGYGTSVPLVALLDNESDTSVSLSAAPAANLLQLATVATSLGHVAQPSLGVAFAAAYRVSASTPAITLSFHIAGGQACPRDVLRMYSTRHAEAFDPPNSNVHYRASGMGSYAATQPPLMQMVDGAPLIKTLNTVGYKVNWDGEQCLHMHRT